MRAEKLNYMIPLGGRGGGEEKQKKKKVTTYQTQCETAMKKSGKTERSGALIIC